MSRKSIILAILLSGIYSGVFAQTSADSVKLVIKQFFAGMLAADSLTIRNTLSPAVVFQTLEKKPAGDVLVKSESVDEFLKSVAQLKPGMADERIEFASLQVDGPLAAVWTPYSFYFNGRFSHCGVNSFQLVRMAGRWVIQYIIDTRRKTNCTMAGGK